MKNDIAMKFVLKNSLQRGVLAEELMGGPPITHWLNTELPKPELLRTDLLGETEKKELVHIEVQSTNDPEIAFRMLKYLFAVKQVHNRLCRQIVLYVGRGKMTMPAEFRWPQGVARVSLIDARELNGRRLLESPELGDNVVAVLTRLADERAAVREIVKKIATLPPGPRLEYFHALLVLAGLRGLEHRVTEEGKGMLEISDILDNQVLGPYFKNGWEKGREEGRAEGMEQGLEKGREEGLEQGRGEGREEGELRLLKRLISERFGALPPWAEEKLSRSKDFETLSKRFLQANSLEELFS